jgi:hypothetical protein
MPFKAVMALTVGRRIAEGLMVRGSAVQNCCGAGADQDARRA